MAREANPSNVRFALKSSLFLTTLIVVGIFMTDWFFIDKTGNRILDGALAGVLIGYPLGWWSKKLDFYFPTSKGAPPDDGNES